MTVAQIRFISGAGLSLQVRVEIVEYPLAAPPRPVLKENPLWQISTEYKLRYGPTDPGNNYSKFQVLTL